MFRQFSIVSRLFFVMCGLSLVLALLGVGVFWQTAYEYKRKDLSVRIATASVRLSRAIIPALANQDIKMTEAVISAFAGTPEVSCVTLKARGTTEPLYWPDANCVANNPELLLHTQPIRRGIRVLGEVNVYFTNQFILTELGLALRIIAIGLVSILLGCLIALWIAQRRIALRPINRIVTTINRFRQGLMEARIGPLPAAPELRAISTAFDAMAQELETATAKITQQATELREKHDIITQSLDYGSSVQNKLISLDPVKGSPIEVDGFVQQLSQVGGDFYVGIDQPERYVLFFADATGHGIPGALATVVLSMAVRNAVALQPDAGPGVIIEDIHRRIITGLRDRRVSETDVRLGADATLLMYHKATQKITWCSAKQPFLIAHAGELTFAQADRQSLGYEVEAKTFTVFEASFGDAGDVLVFCSDGILDAPGGAKGFGFGKRRLKRVVQASLSNHATASQIVQSIRAETFAYLGEHSLVDDMSVVVMRATLAGN